MDQTSASDASPDWLAPDDVTTHGFTDELGDVVALVGYLGEGDSSDRRRLFEDLAFARYLTVDVNDIVGRSSAAGPHDLTSGQSVIYVRRDASLVLCKAVRASQFESGPDIQPSSSKWPRPGGGG
jgi:hypothetical protein